MTAVHILVLVIGALLALVVLGSALKTVVLPQKGNPRLSGFVFALVYRLLVRRHRSDPLSAALRRMYAPVALVSLPLAWMILMMVAFTAVYWGTGDLTWSNGFEISVSSLTTMGFDEPHGTGRISIAFVQATIGLGLVALLISYLPTIYSAYNGREKGANRLRPIAGTPPAAPDFIRSLHRIGSFDTPEVWRNAADWMLDLEQTHTAFPHFELLPRVRHRTVVGRHCRDGAGRVSAGLLGLGRRLRRGVRRRAERPAHRPRLRAPGHCVDRPRRQRPTARTRPSCKTSWRAPPSPHRR